MKRKSWWKFDIPLSGTQNETVVNDSERKFISSMEENSSPQTWGESEGKVNYKHANFVVCTLIPANTEVHLKTRGLFELVLSITLVSFHLLSACLVIIFLI